MFVMECVLKILDKNSVVLCLIFLVPFEILRNTIDSLLNTPQTACMEASTAVCENFLHSFIDKVTSIRAQISPSFYDQNENWLFKEFLMISF